MKLLIYTLLLAMASVALFACGGEEPKDGENVFAIDGVKHKIANVGIYGGQNGYDIVFVDNASIDLSKAIGDYDYFYAKCSSAVVDINKSLLGKNISDIDDFVAEGWNSYIGFRDKGKDSHYWTDEDLDYINPFSCYVTYKSGKLTANISLEGSWSGVKHTFSMTYSGKPVVSKEYIYY